MPQRSLVVNFIGDTKSFEAASARVGGGLNGIEAAGKRASSVGKSLTRNLTVPIVGLGIASGKMASDFGAAMERLHTQAGVSQKAVGALSKGVLNMAGPVGIGPKTLADGIYHVASSLNATLPPAQRASTELNVLRIAAEGARVGNANLVDVTNALDAAIVSGIGGVQNYGQAMGALNAIVGAGDMTMQDLADALSTGLLAPMKTYGLTLKDVGGALAVFGDNNIRGQDAATKLISAVRIMAAPSKAAAKELATVGLSTLSLANDMRKGGLVLALSDLKKHLDAAGLTASQQGLVIAHAFGGKQSTGVQVLLGQLDRLRAKTKDVGDGAHGFAQAWSATQLTASQKTKQALATMEADLTRFGTEALPTLLSAGGTIVKDVDKVAHAFSSLPKGAQDAIITGGLITAGVGPALKVVGLVTGLVGKAWGLTKVIGGVAGIGKAGGLVSGKSLNQTVGTMEVGTLIAKNMVGGPGGKAVPPIAGAAGEGAASVEVAAAARAARITAGVAGVSVAGVSGFAAASKAQGTPLNKLDAFAHGVDPTAVLHLVGLPALSDLLPAVRKRRPLSAGDIAALGEGFSLPSLQRVQSGNAQYGGGPGQATAIARGGPIPASAHQNLSQFTLDVQQATRVFQTLQARVTGYKFADRLAVDFAKSRTVSSRGIQNVIREINKLPPAQRAAAASGMLAMVHEFETKGKLAAGSTRKLRGAIASELEAMVRKADRSAASMASAIQGGSVKAFAAVSSNFQKILNTINADMSKSVISVQTGVALIDKALNSELAAFGGPSINLHAKTLVGALSKFPKLSATFPSNGGAAAHPAASSSGSAGRADVSATKRAAASHWHWNPFDGRYEMLSPSAWSALQSRIYGAKNAGTKLPTSAALHAPTPRAPSAAKTPAWLTATLATIKSQTTLDQIQAQALQNAVAAAQNSQDLTRANALLLRELKLEQGFLTADRQQLRKVNEVLSKRHLTASQRQKVESAKLALLNEIGSVQGTISGLQSSLTGGGDASQFDLAPGNIKLPTLYDVGRGIQGGRPRGLPRGATLHKGLPSGSTLHKGLPGGTFHVDARATYHIRIDKDVDVHKFADTLDRHTGGHLKAKMKAAGLA